jgi:hypothetical protein
MPVTNLIVFFLIFFITSCSQKKEVIDISELIKNVAQCNEDIEGCPDSVFVSKTFDNVSLFNHPNLNNCYEIINELNISSFKLSSKIQSIEYKKNGSFFIGDFEKGDNWIPPKRDNSKKVYMLYSSPLINESHLIIYVSMIISGKDMVMSICNFKRLNGNYIFDGCDCGYNPY